MSTVVWPRQEAALASAALALGLCGLGLIFQPEIAAALYQWAHSAAFNYCFLVLPVAAYLAWDRRAAVLASPLRPAPWFVLLAAPAAALWFAAERLGVMEGRQLMAMTLLQTMFITVLGWRTWRVLAIPLLYLYFAVPVGEFLKPTLQWIAVHFATIALTLCGVPNFASGGIIEIPQMTFFVGDECSGFNYLVSSTAFGFLYASVMYTSRIRRVSFVLFAMAIPIVANGLRVAGTIILGQFVSAKVIELDHTSWGWYFFSFIILIQILAGLWFRQERRREILGEAVGGASIKPGRLAAAMIPVLLFAAIPPAIASWLDRPDTGDELAMQTDWPTVAGCAVAPIVPSGAAIGELAAIPGVAMVAADYDCGEVRFRLSFYRFPPRTSAFPVFALLHDAAESQALSALHIGGGAEAPIWNVPSDAARSAGTGSGLQFAAAALWVDGQPSAPGIGARLRQALNSIRSAPVSPIVAVVARSAWPRSGASTVENFLMQIPRPTQWIDKKDVKNSGRF